MSRIAFGCDPTDLESEMTEEPAMELAVSPDLGRIVSEEVEGDDGIEIVRIIHGNRDISSLLEHP